MADRCREGPSTVEDVGNSVQDSGQPLYSCVVVPESKTEKGKRSVGSTCHAVKGGVCDGGAAAASPLPAKAVTMVRALGFSLLTSTTSSTSKALTVDTTLNFVTQLVFSNFVFLSFLHSTLSNGNISHYSSS